MSTSTTQPQICHGQCQCGAVKFSCKVPDLKSAASCNCSICFLKGYLWMFPEEFTIEQGQDSIAEYFFGRKKFNHKFCSICGTAICAVNTAGPAGQLNTGVNARAFSDPYMNLLPGKQVPPLEISAFDGKSIPSDYKMSFLPLPDDFHAADGEKVYLGTCHCGAVQIAVATKVIQMGEGIAEENVQQIKACNCTACSRGACLWIYPARDKVRLLTDPSAITEYTGGRHRVHQFCKTCGVPVMVKYVAGPNTGVNPVNVRTFKDIDLTKSRELLWENALTWKAADSKQA